MIVSPKITLQYIGLAFIKIGAISWGGFMMLVSIIQKELCSKDQTVSDETVLDGVALASVLPGPMAFNVVAYIGYKLKGLKGSLMAMIGILVPSGLLMILFSLLYFRFGELPLFTNLFKGILPAVAAIILSVAINMSKKHLEDKLQILFCISSGVLLLLVNELFISIIIILAGSIAGYVVYKRSISIDDLPPCKTSKPNYRNTIILLFTLLLIGIIPGVLPFLLPARFLEWSILQRDISYTFSSMSLTLFGGGYVIIPVIQNVIVNNLGWLSNKEFADAIALGQVTPGPIFISATFIGYKVGGFIGALNATISIFFPPAIVMVLLSQYIEHIKHSPVVKAIFKGLRPVVIGMIFSAVITIGKSADISWSSVAIFATVFFLAYRYKINVVYLILIAGLTGTILF